MQSGSSKKIKGVSILGSTGSIGLSTLDVIRSHPDRFRVISLAAGNNVDLLKKQVEEFRPCFVSVQSEGALKEVEKALPPGGGVEAGFGGEGAVRAATFEGADMTVSAISGAAGLVPTIAAVRAGKDIALANKETLVLAGSIVMKEARDRGVRILPVDSEHSAVFQSMVGHRKDDIKRIILTASGGPFLKTPAQRLETVTPEEALNHPKWKMGRKITIDSATLMNKGLEVIEAAVLFGMPSSRISVVIHPQSIVHSMVEYVDGSIMAQMSNPDMRGPIAYALSYPERIPSGTLELSFNPLNLEFMEPDLERFPCLGLAFKALEMGGTAPAVLNAADEEAVELFLNKKITFTGIYRLISGVLDRHAVRPVEKIEDVLEADAWAREQARGLAHA